MKIVITGSLGHIGKPLTEILTESGHSVTVVSSQPQRQAEIEALGATAAIGTLEDTGFLTQALKGADAVFTLVPPRYDAPDQVEYYQRIGRHFAEAIRAAGIQHVVNLSSYGAHLDKNTGVILGVHFTEQLLNALPESASVTHLRPGYFYYNLLNFAGMIRHAGIMGANYGGSDLLTLTAPQDIAEAAAEELSAPGSGRKIRYVVSDEKTATEVAAAIGHAVGKPDLQWITFTDEQSTQGMLDNGMSPHMAEMLTQLGARIHDGTLVEDYERHRPAFGKVKLHDYLPEIVAAYQHQSDQYGG